jgi:hypothetical protein
MKARMSDLPGHLRANEFKLAKTFVAEEPQFSRLTLNRLYPAGETVHLARWSTALNDFGAVPDSEWQDFVSFGDTVAEYREYLASGEPHPTEIAAGNGQLQLDGQTNLAYWEKLPDGSRHRGFRYMVKMAGEDHWPVGGRKEADAVVRYINAGHGRQDV